MRKILALPCALMLVCALFLTSCTVLGGMAKGTETAATAKPLDISPELTELYLSREILPVMSYDLSGYITSNKRISMEESKTVNYASFAQGSEYCVSLLNKDLDCTFTRKYGTQLIRFATKEYEHAFGIFKNDIDEGTSTLYLYNTKTMKYVKMNNVGIIEELYDIISVMLEFPPFSSFTSDDIFLHNLEIDDEKYTYEYHVSRSTGFHFGFLFDDDGQFRRLIATHPENNVELGCYMLTNEVPDELLQLPEGYSEVLISGNEEDYEDLFNHFVGEGFEADEEEDSEAVNKPGTNSDTEEDSDTVGEPDANSDAAFEIEIESYKSDKLQKEGLELTINGVRFPLPCTLSDMGEKWSFDTGDMSRSFSFNNDEGEEIRIVGNFITTNEKIGTEEEEFFTAATLCYENKPVCSAFFRGEVPEKDNHDKVEMIIFLFKQDSLYNSYDIKLNGISLGSDISEFKESFSDWALLSSEENENEQSLGLMNLPLYLFLQSNKEDIPAEVLTNGDVANPVTSMNIAFVPLF
ncbi:MAG: hypothetical protein LBS21_06390 [Clostridiales bacterium]|jgi:hypothetical protein|nr:hypothetical protein [Clostridiales bacterium]